MYSSRDKTLTLPNGKKFYFYNGKPVNDFHGYFIFRLLCNGYEPKHENELIEMYLELKAGDAHLASYTKNRWRNAVLWFKNMRT
jgi:hypothetical protein